MIYKTRDQVFIPWSFVYVAFLTLQLQYSKKKYTPARKKLFFCKINNLEKALSKKSTF